jgi:hypothetical protein
MADVSIKSRFGMARPAQGLEQAGRPAITWRHAHQYTALFQALARRGNAAPREAF